MSFRDFTFPDVLNTLGLSVRSEELFPGAPTLPIRPDLAKALSAGVLLSSGLYNEKSRSEFVIAPLLMELQLLYPDRFGLFSGIELSVDVDKGLNGICDFLITRVPNIYIVQAPIVAVAEAKNDNVHNGFGQCIAGMFAAAMYNATAKTPVSAMYGISTTGTHWKFLRLTDTTVTIDRADYFIDHPERVLGVLARMIGTA